MTAEAAPDTEHAAAPRTYWGHLISLRWCPKCEVASNAKSCWICGGPTSFEPIGVRA